MFQKGLRVLFRSNWLTGLKRSIFKMDNYSILLRKRLKKDEFPMRWLKLEFQFQKTR